MSDKFSYLEDDGLYTPEVGEWSEVKYKLVSYYASMFATSMKAKWPGRIYIDLFAGAGKARIKGTNKIVLASPLLALNIQHKFDQYIFCEADKRTMEALKERIRAEANPGCRVDLFFGDVNINVDEINGKLISNSISLCFIDPFYSENFKFSTIQKLSSRAIDFIVLIPSFMDVNRNLDTYSEEEHKTVEEFIGNKSWRDEWQKSTGESFGLFFISMFTNRMAKLGFLNGEPQPVYHTGKRLLYHLAFFSKHPLGIDFWNKARKSTDTQMDLF